MNGHYQVWPAKLQSCLPAPKPNAATPAASPPSLQPLKSVFLEVTKQPLPRRAPDPLRKNPRQGRGICIAQVGGNELDSLALAQPLLGDGQTPVRQIVRRPHAHGSFESTRKRTARHCRRFSQQINGPGHMWTFMHCRQCAGQLRIGQSADQSHCNAAFLAMIQQPTQELHQHHLKQAINDESVATANQLRFVKKQVQSRRERR